MNELSILGAELLKKYEILATEYAPEALELAIRNIQLEAIQCIVWMVTLFAMALGGSIAIYYGYKYYIDQKGELHYFSDGWQFMTVVLLVIIGITTITCGIWFIAEVVNIWVWVAFIDPKMALVHSLL